MRNAALVAKPLKKVALRDSSPHPTTEGVNPETLKEKVDDSWKDSNMLP